MDFRWEHHAIVLILAVGVAGQTHAGNVTATFETLAIAIGVGYFAMAGVIWAYWRYVDRFVEDGPILETLSSLRTGN